MNNLIRCLIIFVSLSFTNCLSISAQENPGEIKELLESINSSFENLSHRLDQIEKAIDDIYWYNKVGDVAVIDKEIPGGHSFDRMDTKMAKEIRLKIYYFLAGYLDPPKKFSTVKDLQKAAYIF